MSTGKELRERFERWWKTQHVPDIVTPDHVALTAYKAAYSEARAEIEALRKDAERYRAIRDGIGVVEWKAITGTLIGMLPNGDKLDRAIDDSMASEVSSNGQ